MNGFQTLKIEAFVAEAVKQVFDTMLSMEIEKEPTPSPMNQEHKIVASVGFAGNMLGNLNLHVTDTFARTLAAAMLGVTPEEIAGEEEIHDVLGEICNVVGGNLKSRLCDQGYPCQLSIPSITSGEHFQIESRGWMRSEHLGFRCRQEVMRIDVYIKLAE